MHPVTSVVDPSSLQQMAHDASNVTHGDVVKPSFLFVVAR